HRGNKGGACGDMAVTKIKASNPQGLALRAKNASPPQRTGGRISKMPMPPSLTGIYGKRYR
ncbi:MAG: hypothetical protein ACLTV0_12170, partial [Faecalimonas sp.]